MGKRQIKLGAMAVVERALELSGCRFKVAGGSFPSSWFNFGADINRNMLMMGPCRI